MLLFFSQHQHYTVEVRRRKRHALKTIWRLDRFAGVFYYRGVKRGELCLRRLLGGRASCVGNLGVRVALWN